MNGKKLRLEKWHCSNKEEEIHYFIGDKYVIGYNPKLISEEAIEMLLATERVSLYIIPER